MSRGWRGVAASPGFVSQNQRFAADASGNGGVTSNDAAVIARPKGQKKALENQGLTLINSVQD